MIEIKGKAHIADIAFTHAGIMHADDVMSAALLRLLNPKIVFCRYNEAPSNIDDDRIIVFDIGGGKYDHHQRGAEEREDGCKYASFGLLWREFGKCFVSEENVEKFDKMFVEPLDRSDNYGDYDSLCEAIAGFNLTWDEQPDDALSGNKMTNRRFLEAVDFAVPILSRQIEHLQAEERACPIVEEAMAKMQCGIIVLDQNLPWDAPACRDPRSMFVVYPSSRGGYSACGVPIKEGDPNKRCPFPSSWAGLRGWELEDFSGIKGLTFCHAGRFMVSAETQQAAILACIQALRTNRSRLPFRYPSLEELDAYVPEFKAGEGGVKEWPSYLKA